MKVINNRELQRRRKARYWAAIRAWLRLCNEGGLYSDESRELVFEIKRLAEVA